MKKLYLLLILISIAQSITAQQIDYSRKWFIGFNAGTTWHTTDVKNVNDFGWGFTLGRSYGYSYGSPLSWDLRMRFLKGYWHGQDIDSTGANTYNNTLSQGSTNYFDSLGFGVQNFQNENYKINLELLLHANRFRARTGWDPYIFLGAGLSINQAYGDYLKYDTTGVEVGPSPEVIYNYDPSQLGKAYLRSTQDGVFETALDGHNQDKFKVQVMPSIGFGIGREFGVGHTFGLEHKTTFTLDDNFDGVGLDSKFSSDIYHYTNLYVQFRIKGKEQEEEAVLPEVEFTDPDVDRKIVNDPVYIVKAIAKHIDSRENLTFTMNNRVSDDFIYNSESDQFTSEVRLKVGENILHLAGVNVFGSDDDQVIIVYEKIEEPTPPVVEFLRPNNDVTRVRQANYSAEAEALNITEKSQLRVEHNGRAVGQFAFDSVRKVIRFNVQLTPGANRLFVEGTNKDGVSSDLATIHFDEQPLVQKPEVQFTNPSRSNLQVQDANFQARAIIRNVESRSGVQFRFNGRVNSSFSFDPNRDAFVSNVRLAPGQNILEIIGSNEAGQATASTVIRLFVQEPQPPIVSISNPQSSTDVVQDAQFVFVGRVLNVERSSQVQLIVNGRQQQTFDFDAQSGQVTKVVTLNEGTNRFELSGSNQDGTDSQSAQVVYRKAVNVDPPSVRIYNPSTSPYTTQNDNHTVLASVQGLTNNTQIEVQLNGRIVNGWSLRNGVVSYPASLIEGANVFQIEVENEAGRDEDQVVIRYEKPQTVDPPIVRFTNPARSPFTTSEARMVVKATVENVNSKSDITVRVNGQSTGSFAYSSSSELVSLNVGLLEGSNVVEIEARNTGGSDQASTTIIYRPVNQEELPVVNIVEPTRSPLITESQRVLIKANVSNISTQNQLTVTINGRSTNNFSFDSNSEVVEFTLDCVEGNNSIEVKGTNSAGTASDNATVRYTVPVEQFPPAVTFLSPETPGQRVSDNHFTFIAKLDHIEQESQIQVKVNGRIIQSGYNYDLNTHKLSVPVALKIGSNLVEVLVSNDVGSARASTSVNYQKRDEPCDAPVITLVSPNSGSVSVRKELFVASFNVTGVNNSNEVRATFNGQYKVVQRTMSGFQVQVNLSQGLNSLELKAANQCGVSNKLISIKYVPDDNPCSRPSISWINPNDSVYSTESSSIELEAAIRGVQSAANIQFTLNGNAQNGSYDPAAGTFTKQITLNEGWNLVELLATNSCGPTSRQVRIERLPCNAPSFNLEQANVASGGETFGNSLSVVLDVNDVESGNQIQVKLNGRFQAVNYNAATNKLLINVGLSMGSNVLEVIASTSCGTGLYRHLVTKKQAAPKTPPSIELLVPTSGKNNVDQALQTVQLRTKEVSSQEELVMKLNGRNVAFRFNEKTGIVSSTLKLRVGSNHLIVTAANSNGSSSAELYFDYKPKVEIQKPVISINQPSQITTVVGKGLQSVKGSVTNLQNGGSLSATVNGKPVRLSKKQVGAQTQFSFAINVSATHGKYNVVVTAKNSAGTDVERRVIVLKSTTPVIKPKTDEKGSDKGIIKAPKKVNTRGNN